MSPLYVGLFIAVFGIILSMVSDILKKKRVSNEKYQNILNEFLNDVINILEPDEELEAYCGYYPCAAVTNKRLLISGKNSIESIEFLQIKKIKGMGFSGTSTKNPNQMLTLEIKAEKKYYIGNESEGFIQVVEFLNTHLDSNKSHKKSKKEF